MQKTSLPSRPPIGMDVVARHEGEANVLSRKIFSYKLEGMVGIITRALCRVCVDAPTNSTARKFGPCGWTPNTMCHIPPSSQQVDFKRKEGYHSSAAPTKRYTQSSYRKQAKADMSTYDMKFFPLSSRCLGQRNDIQ